MHFFTSVAGGAGFIPLRCMVYPEKNKAPAQCRGGWLEEIPEGLFTDLVMNDQPVGAVLNPKCTRLGNGHALKSDLVESVQCLVYLLKGHFLYLLFDLFNLPMSLLYQIVLTMSSMSFNEFAYSFLQGMLCRY